MCLPLQPPFRSGDCSVASVRGDRVRECGGGRGSLQHEDMTGRDVCSTSAWRAASHSLQRENLEQENGWWNKEPEGRGRRRRSLYASIP